MPLRNLRVWRAAEGDACYDALCAQKLPAGPHGVLLRRVETVLLTLWDCTVTVASVSAVTVAGWKRSGSVALVATNACSPSRVCSCVWRMHALGTAGRGW